MRLKHPPAPQRPRQMQKGKRSSYTLTTLPLLQANAAPWRGLLEPLAPPVGRKKNRVGDNKLVLISLSHILWVALWKRLLWSCPLETAWKTTGNLTVMKNWGWACNNQHLDLGRSSSYLQCPSSNTNQQLCSSTEPSRWNTLTMELGGVQICLIQISNEEFCQS